MAERRVMGKWMLISFTVAFILFIAGALFLVEQNRAGEVVGEFEIVDTGWQFQGEALDVLPSHLDSAGSGSVSISRTLDGTTHDDDYIGFFTTFQTAKVSVDEEVIFALSNPVGSMSSTPGKVWNFVNLQAEHAGQTLTVVITNSYGTGEVAIPRFYFGDQSAIILNFLAGQAFALVLSVLMILIAIVGFFYYLFAKKKSRDETMLYFAVTIFFMGIWSLMEAQVLPLFFGHALLSNQVAFITLRIGNFTQLQFMMIALALKEDKFMKFLLWVNFINFWANVILQVTGVLDFMQTSYPATFIGVLSIIYTFIVVFRLLLQNRKKNQKLQLILWGYMIMFIISALFGILGTFYSYSYNVIDSARYSRIGIALFLIGMIFLVLNNSVKLMEEGREAKTIKIKAETDSMTKLKNRNAFDVEIERLSTLSSADLSGTGIVMCDLNNLKMANDTYGHEMGDHYIITSSGIIQKFYGTYGQAYRIGGDEFAVIVKGLSWDVAEELRHKVTTEAAMLSESEPFSTHSFAMGIAAGYVQFDATFDETIKDTLKRADAVMYDNKSRMKHRGHNRAEDFEKEEDA